jgi:acyl dehydratase
VNPRGIEVVEVGQSAAYTRRVTDDDIVRYADLSGDDHPQHVDEAWARTTRFGGRIAHGALLVGYMSAASTTWVRRWLAGRTSQSTVSYGYDRIRFVKPVFPGDTIEVTHEVDTVDAATGKFIASVTARNHDGVVVAAARHVMAFV